MVPEVRGSNLSPPVLIIVGKLVRRFCVGVDASLHPTAGRADQFIAGDVLVLKLKIS